MLVHEAKTGRNTSKSVTAGTITEQVLAFLRYLFEHADGDAVVAYDEIITDVNHRKKGQTRLRTAKDLKE